MNRAKVAFALVLAGSIGCGVEDEELELSTTVSELTYGGTTVDPENWRLANNRLANNRLANNRLANNRLANNRLVTAALAPGTSLNTSFEYEMADAATRDYFSYVVGCALRSDQQVKFRANHGGGKYVTYTFHGEVAFAPEWKDGPCGTACQQKVSGCVLARVNWLGYGKALSLRVLGDTVLPQEDVDHPFINEAFYGNLFGDTASMNVCSYDGGTRGCDGYSDPDCPIMWRGACDCTRSSGTPDSGPNGRCTPNNPYQPFPQEACRYGLRSGGTFASCSDGDWLDNDPPRTQNFTYAIAVHSAVDKNGTADNCPHPDYVVGAKLAPAGCSLCARKVSRLGGISHADDVTPIAAKPSCSDTYWYTSCKNAVSAARTPSRARRGEHVAWSRDAEYPLSPSRSARSPRAAAPAL